MLKKKRLFAGVLWVLFSLSCGLTSPVSSSNPELVAQSPAAPLAAAVTPTAYLPMVSSDALQLAPDRLQPADLVYLGAFRLPDGPPEHDWAWGGGSLTYYPHGDPGGPGDGFPGSLFGSGHDWHQDLSEISIPAPVISAGRDLAALNMAGTLQAFQGIWGNLFPELEIARIGLAYLGPQGEQTAGKLYFARAQHMGETDTLPTHGWADLDLSHPQTAGTWRVGEYWNYVSGDYLFDIPTDWSDQYLDGKYLATGRFRDGGQGAQGPAILAIAPWQQGNPPGPGSTLPATPLLLYGAVYDQGAPAMTGYHHSDDWTGAAWITAGSKAAVIFVGTKGVGDCWYGCMDGTVWPDEPPFPPECPERGWWSSAFAGQMLFYDPAQLAQVAAGELEPWQPQPYAILELDPYLFHIDGPQLKAHVGAIAFDREHGLLYLLELFADQDKPIVHVWRVEG